MAKTYKNLFDNALTFSKLMEAHNKARKGKRFRNEVILFEQDLESNLLEIARDLKRGTYKPLGYREFYVYEPKERLIKAAPYKDRVIHQWYVLNFIKPVFQPIFIYDSYACLDGKGMHRAAYRVQNFLREAARKYEKPYILKADVSKYFFNIDHDVLFDIIQKRIKDKKVLWLTKVFIDSVDNPGIPVGSYTSQFFANVYLNELDYFVKHELKVKYYVRYMDDFILVLNNKDEAKETLQTVTEFIQEKLKLKLNDKTQIFPLKNGVNFCGYKIKTTHMLIRDASKRRIKRKLKRFQVKYKNNEMTLADIHAALASWIGYAQKASSKNLIETICSRFSFKK